MNQQTGAESRDKRLTRNLFLTFAFVFFVERGQSCKKKKVYEEFQKVIIIIIIFSWDTTTIISINKIISQYFIILHYFYCRFLKVPKCQSCSFPISLYLCDCMKNCCNLFFLFQVCCIFNCCKKVNIFPGSLICQLDDKYSLCSIRS